MERHEYFQLFHAISADDFSLLTSKLKNKHFKKGALITVPGQIQKNLFFVKAGVQMSYFDSGNKTHVIAFTYPPNICADERSYY